MKIKEVVVQFTETKKDAPVPEGSVDDKSGPDQPLASDYSDYNHYHLKEGWEQILLRIA